MSGDTIAIILVGVAMLVGFLAPIALLLADDLSSPLLAWKKRQRQRKESHLPAYERLARAYEREADRLIERGRIDSARKKLREAQRIRTEATEAMMRGDEPPL